MFERFTERARRIIILAQEEAKRLNHSAVGTEHILLGVVREGEGVASKVLESLNVEPDRILLAYAGGDAGLFSMVYGSWAAGEIGSAPVTVSVEPWR